MFYSPMRENTCFPFLNLADSLSQTTQVNNLQLHFGISASPHLHLRQLNLITSSLLHSTTSCQSRSPSVVLLGTLCDVKKPQIFL